MFGFFFHIIDTYTQNLLNFSNRIDVQPLNGYLKDAEHVPFTCVAFNY